MKLPNPLAVSKQEAYLAIKSGKLTQEQYDEVYKPSLLNPDNNFEAWLAKWCGLVEGYPKDENDVPLCLCDEEALVAYLCGVKTTYPADHQNPMDIRLAAYLRYLISGIYGRPEYPVTTSEYWLSQMDAPNITNDTPSASFEFNGTAEAPLLDLKAFGDTKQNTLSGKNIFPLSIVQSGTANGVTYTNNGDSLDIKGTATAGIDRGGYVPLTDVPASLIQAGGTYTLSTNQPIPTGVRIQVNTYTDSAYAGQICVLTGNGSATKATGIGITIPSGATRVRYLVTVTNGTAVDITGLKIMLTKSLADINSSANRTGGTAVVTKQSGGFKLGGGDSNYGYYGTLMDKDAISKKDIKPSFGSTVAGAKVKFYYASTVGGGLTWLFNGKAFASGETVSMPDLSSYAQVYMVFYIGDNSSGTAGQTEITYSNIIVEPVPNDFEPYCGGIASPNPDYPQTVQTVTGRQVVAVGSNNLAVLTDGMQAEAGVTTIRYALEQKATILGTANSDSWPALASNINVYAGKTYVMSITRPLPFPISFRTRGINSRLMNIPAGSTVSNSWTPSEDDYGWIFASVTRGTTVYETDIRVQVEEGSTATEYRPAQREYSLNLCENDFSTEFNTQNYNGKIDILGKDSFKTIATVSSPGSTVYSRFLVTGLKKNTDYDIHYNWELLSGNPSIGTLGKLSVRPEGSSIPTPSSGDRIVNTGNGTSLELFFYLGQGSVGIDGGEILFYNVSLSENKGGIELCKLGSGDTIYQDVIFRNNPISEYFDQSLDLDKWYIKKMVGKRVYLSSDIEAISQTYQNIEYIAALKPTDSDAYGKYGQKEMVCSHATATDTTGTWDSAQNIGKIVSGSSLNAYWFGFAKGTSVDAMKNALDGSKLYYVLKEPTVEPIEGELANQLDAIVSGGTYEGYTAFTVETTGNNLPALLQVKAIPQVDPNAAENTRWYGAKKDPAEWAKTE